MSPQTSQSVGTSHSRAEHRGHTNPALRKAAWHTHKAGAEVAGTRVGNPINIKSADGFVEADGTVLFPIPGTRLGVR